MYAVHVPKLGEGPAPQGRGAAVVRIARRKLFEEVDKALTLRCELDPIWLLGAVVLLREVTKEDAPFVAHLHETEEERRQRARYGGWQP